jgi:hypothetical protein
MVPQCSHRYEEAATRILAGEHLVDFVDLNVSDVVLFHYTERVPVVIILKNVSDGERGTCKDAEEKCDDVYFGGDVEIHQLNIGLGGGKYCAEWAQGYSVYTI